MLGRNLILLLKRKQVLINVSYVNDYTKGTKINTCWAFDTWIIHLEIFQLEHFAWFLPEGRRELVPGARLIM